MKRVCLSLLVLVVVGVFITSVCFGKNPEEKLDYRVEMLEQTVASQAEQIEALDGQILSLQNDYEDLYKRFLKIANYVDHAMRDIDDIQQYINFELKDELRWIKNDITNNDSAIARNFEQLLIFTGRLNTIEPKVGKLGPPDYDSGWFTVDPGDWQNITHNLGTQYQDPAINEKCIVDMQLKDQFGSIHHKNYGGTYWDEYWGYKGIYWYRFTSDEIRILNLPESDPFDYDQIRIRIWVIDTNIPTNP